jgi:hypothetical protein
MLEKEIVGINLNEEGQLKLIEEFKMFYKEIPFQDNKVESFRLFRKNAIV